LKVEAAARFYAEEAVGFSGEAVEELLVVEELLRY